MMQLSCIIYYRGKYYMKNDFLQNKIEKEMNKRHFQFSAKYCIPFFALLFIDIIYFFFSRGNAISDISSFVNKYSTFLLILINCITLFYNSKRNKLDKINFLKENTAKMRIHMEASVHDNNVILKCQVENISKVDFSLENCYIYIDSGVYNIQTKEYEFPFLQNRNISISEKSESDCIASFYCKNKICNYPEILAKTLPSQSTLVYTCFNLDHLSHDSLAYIGSNECFNQEIVVHLEKGIYRAIMVAIPDESCDCKCYSACFIID